MLGARNLSAWLVDGAGDHRLLRRTPGRAAGAAAFFLPLAEGENRRRSCISVARTSTFRSRLRSRCRRRRRCRRAPKAVGVADATLPLIALAVGRSGDKGNSANIGLIARKPDYLPWMRAALMEEVVRDWFAHLGVSKVERFELPGMNAFNFLLHDALGGGGVASLRVDAQGKALCADADGLSDTRAHGAGEFIEECAARSSDRVDRRIDMTQQFGKTDDELATMPLTFRDGLFAGQVVLVSGAGRGIGKAIAFQFARLGAKLVLCGRDAERLATRSPASCRLSAPKCSVIRCRSAIPRRWRGCSMWWRNASERHRRAGQQCGRPISASSDRFLAERLERGRRHQSDRHLVHDAAGGAAVARRRTRRPHRQHRRGDDPRHARRGAYRGSAGGRGRAVEDGGDRMGAARHPDQLRGARHHRDRRHERLFAGGARSVAQDQSACAASATFATSPMRSVISPGPRARSLPAR